MHLYITELFLELLYIVSKQVFLTRILSYREVEVPAQGSMERLIKIWDERKVFDREFIQKLKNGFSKGQSKPEPENPKPKGYGLLYIFVIHVNQRMYTCIEYFTVQHHYLMKNNNELMYTEIFLQVCRSFS